MQTTIISLNIGPDAANLMGIKRSADTVANTLNCRSWLRDQDDDEDDDSSVNDDDENDNDGTVQHTKRKKKKNSSLIGGAGGVLSNQYRHLLWDEESDEESNGDDDDDYSLSTPCSSDSDQDVEKDCDRSLLVVE